MAEICKSLFAQTASMRALQGPCRLLREDDDPRADDEALEAAMEAYGTRAPSAVPSFFGGAPMSAGLLAAFAAYDTGKGKDKGKGKHKGKDDDVGKGKGQGKGKDKERRARQTRTTTIGGLEVVRDTPDRRFICFKWNNGEECDGSCGMVRCCRVLGGAWQQITA